MRDIFFLLLRAPRCGFFFFVARFGFLVAVSLASFPGFEVFRRFFAAAKMPSQRITIIIDTTRNAHCFVGDEDE